MKRSKHNLSNYRLATLRAGQLSPVGLAEVLPGDSFRHQSAVLLRCLPLVAPVMHPVTLRLHHWFVPYRLIWDEWEDFITGEADVNPPTVENFDNSNLMDNLGVHPDYVGDVSALPIRAYNLIWNEFYRDQDLRTEKVPDTRATERVSWEKDYFTAARPSPQKGPAVSLPLGTYAPIQGLGTVNRGPSSEQDYRATGGQDRTETGWNTGAEQSPNDIWFMKEDPDNPGYPDVTVDLSNAAAATVEQLREAFALQRYAEARSIYGSRYTEYLRYLGVKASDGRLQRPEYLGGGKQTISFSEVLSTADSQNTPVGDLKGHGIAAMRTRPYKRFFEEHGLVMTLASIRPKAIYTHASDKLWWRKTKEDFWQKELESLGHQVIQNKEAMITHSDPDGTFGYTPRYDDYRSIRSQVSGDFRNVLNSWHFSREFDDDIALNQAFIDCNPPDRQFADQNEDNYVCMVSHDLRARRLVSKRARV
jgi:hypothetical protein